MDYKIFENGKHINTIFADEAFVTTYCEANGYTYEIIPEPIEETESQPTEMEQLRADVDYIAALMGVEL